MTKLKKKFFQRPFFFKQKTIEKNKNNDDNRYDFTCNNFTCELEHDDDDDAIKPYRALYANH